MVNNGKTKRMKTLNEKIKKQNQINKNDNNMFTLSPRASMHCVCYLLVWLGVVGCEGVASSFVGFDDVLFRVVLVDTRNPSTVN